MWIQFKQWGLYTEDCVLYKETMLTVGILSHGAFQRCKWFPAQRKGQTNKQVASRWWLVLAKQSRLNWPVRFRKEIVQNTRGVGTKGREKQVLDHNPTTKRKIWNRWNLLPEGTTTYIFPQIAGKLYRFVLLIGEVFSGKLFSFLLYRVLCKLVRLRSLMLSGVWWRRFAKVLCRVLSKVLSRVQGAVQGCAGFRMLCRVPFRYFRDQFTQQKKAL